MAQIVNLNRFRKGRERSLKEAQAAENRTRFGRSKQERGREAAERDRARKEHQGKRLD